MTTVMERSTRMNAEQSFSMGGGVTENDSLRERSTSWFGSIRLPSPKKFVRQLMAGGNTKATTDYETEKRSDVEGSELPNDTTAEKRISPSDTRVSASDMFSVETVLSPHAKDGTNQAPTIEKVGVSNSDKKGADLASVEVAISDDVGHGVFAAVDSSDGGRNTAVGSTTSDNLCVNCNIDVAGGNCAWLVPCNHLLCSECALALFVSCTGRTACPDCNQSITSHVYIHPTMEGDVDDGFYQSKRSSPVIHQHDETPKREHRKLDPFRFWISQKPRTHKDGMLHGSMVKFAKDKVTNKIKKELLSDTCSFSSSGGFAPESGETSIAEIAEKYLYPNLFAMFQDNATEAETIKELIDAAVCDRSEAMEFLYALATGQTLKEEDREVLQRGPSFKRSSYLAVFVAKEMLIRAGSSGPGSLNRLLGEVIYARSRDTSLIKVLTDFRLTASIDTLHRSDKRLVRSLIANRREPSPFSFQIPSLDNIEFTKRGPDAGKESYTNVVIHEIQKSVLVRDGFYASDPTKRISRKTGTLEEFMEEQRKKGRDPAEALILPSDFDMRMFSLYNLTHMETAIKLRVPSLDRLVAIGEGASYDSTDFGVMPRNLGIDVSSVLLKETDNSKTRVPNFPSKYVKKEEEPLETRQVWNVQESYVSRAAANNSYLDRPNRTNLSKKSTVQMYFNYFHTSFTRDVERDLESLKEGDERPVQEIVFPFCADGNPIANGHEILDKDANSGKPSLWPLLVLFTGGFHFLLEVLNMKGRLVEDFTRHVVSLYRKSKAKQDWVIAPRDPNQAEAESIPVQMAHYRAAADELAEARGIDLVSAAQVHEHMLECAKKSPIAMAFLIETRLTTVYFLLRDSEKARDVDRFFCAVRLALPLFALTNAYRYIRISVELLFWWEVIASMAMKVLFARYIFTRQTADGKGIFTDRYTEWDNGEAYRIPMGKYVHVNHDEKMVKNAVMFNEKQDRRTGLAQVKDRKRTTPTVPFNNSKVHEKNLRIFAHVYSELRKMKVYSVSDKVQVGSKKSTKDANPNLMQNPKGEHTCASMLGFQDDGTNLALDYVRMFYFNSRHSVSRSKTEAAGGVPIRSLRTTAEKQSSAIDNAVILATSLDSKEIVSAAKTKALIVEEIRRVESKLAEEKNVEVESFLPDDYSRTTMLQLADLLVNLRSELFEYVDPISEIKRIRDGGISSSRTSTASRTTQLTSSFYQLDPLIVSDFRDTIPFGSL